MSISPVVSAIRLIEIVEIIGSDALALIILKWFIINLLEKDSQSDQVLPQGGAERAPT